MTNEINLKLNIDGKEATTTILAADNSISELKANAEESGKGFGISWSSALTGINAGVQLTQQALSILSQPIEAAAQFEGFETSLKVMLGSTEAAKARLKELSDFAASTPFELPQVVELGNQLQAIGRYSTENMTILGDLASAAGKPIEQVTGAFAKLATGQKGVAVDMFRDLLITTEDWVKATGKGVDNTGSLLATTEEMMAALPKIMETKSLSGMMEEQSKTFNGILSNFQDSIGALMRTIGEAILPIAKEVLQSIIPIFTFLGENIKVIGTILAGVTTAFVVHFAVLKGGAVVTSVLSALEVARKLILGLQMGATISATLAQLGLNAAMLAGLGPLALIAVAVMGLISLYTNLKGAKENWDKSDRLKAEQKRMYNEKGEQIGINYGAIKQGAEDTKERYKDNSDSELKKEIESRKIEIDKENTRTNYGQNGTVQDQQYYMSLLAEKKALEEIRKEKEKAKATTPTTTPAKTNITVEDKKTREQTIQEELSKWKVLVETGIKGKDEYNALVNKYYDEYSGIVKTRGLEASTEQINMLSSLHSELQQKEEENGDKVLFEKQEKLFKDGELSREKYVDEVEKMYDKYYSIILTKGQNASKSEIEMYDKTKIAMKDLGKTKEDAEKRLSDKMNSIKVGEMDETQKAEYDYNEELNPYLELLRDKLISQEKYNSLEIALARKKAGIIQKIEEKKEAAVLQNTENALATGMNLFGKQTLAYKAMAIAKATIDTWQAATAALSLPFPFNWIQTALVIGSGLANVATITGIGVPEGGGFAQGGLLPAGKSGIIEGWSNEIIAPEKTFVDVMNSNILPQLAVQRQSERQTTNQNYGLDNMATKFESAISRFERKDFKLRGTDIITSGERIAFNNI